MAKQPNETATENKAEPKVTSVTKVSKITLTTFNPKRIAAEKDETFRLFLGNLIGVANGVVHRKAPNGTDPDFIGLGGNFEAHVTGNAPVRSGVLFMPDTFQTDLVNELSDIVDDKTGEVVQAAAQAVKIAFRVSVVRAKNPQGYSWELESFVEGDARVSDPLDALRAILPKAEMKAIAAPEKA